jgi:hypothetical protein
LGMLTPAIRAMNLLVCYSLKGKSPLPLLVARIFADHSHDAVAANDLAVAAHLFN